MAEVAHQQLALDAVSDLARDRGLDEAELWQAVADALLAAYQRQPGAQQDAEVTIDLDQGRITVIGFDADPDGRDVTPDGFGRVAAHVFRSVISQRVEDALRRQAIARFAGREGSIVDARIKHVDARRAVVEVEGIEGILPAEEQLPGDRLRPGRYVTALLMTLRDNGPYTLALSRAHPDFVRALVAAEVPQVAEGSVEIVTVAREAGRRTKIVVRGYDGRHVDPVAAVIGSRGARIRNVQRELGDERVDVLLYSEDPATFVADALGVDRHQVSEFVPGVGEERGRVTVTVPDALMGRVVGQGGANIRLAERVTGCRIDLTAPAAANSDT